MAESAPTPQRRPIDRRKPTIVMDYEPGKQWIREKRYTGAYLVHAIDGDDKRIEVPNPGGY